MEDAYIESALELITPVVEAAIIAAAHYARACGRSTVTAVDVEYGVRYCARTVAGKQVGTLFPELQDRDDDGESTTSDVDADEDDEPFERYSGDDEIANAMNRAYDEWDAWEPYSPLERTLKAAIDNAGY